MKVRALFLLVTVSWCVSCATLESNSSLETAEIDAVCRSQSFLRDNGYLDQPATPDRARIRLELWDKLKYETACEIKREALLAERRTTFSEKLYAVKRDDGDFLVVYRTGPRFSCVRVGELDTEALHLSEANCKPKHSSLKLLSEGKLRCPTSTDSR